MKSRFTYSFDVTIQSIVDKSTGHVTTVEYRPFGPYEIFSVLSDTNTGDRKSPHPQEFRKFFHSEYIGSYSRDDTSTLVVQSGQIGPFFRYVSAEPSSWDDLYNSAVGDLYDKVRSANVGSGLDLSVDLAEAHQVRKMIRDTSSLVSFVKKFSPRNWANSWLEYTYGWKPLVNSVYGTFDALMHRRLNSVAIHRGRSKDSFLDQKSYNQYTFVGSREIVSRRASYRCELVCGFKTENTVAQQLLGYTSLNPVSIAWELLPYSFVVDWILDIGGYLRNMEAALAFRQGFVSGYGSFGYKDSQAGQLFGAGREGDVSQIISGTASSFQSYKKRFVMTDYPIPLIPQFHADLGWRRLISAASLLSQHLRR